MTEVSPFPTLSLDPKSPAGIPFSTQPAQEQDDSQPPPHVKEEMVDKVEGGTQVKPNKALVPLLGVPEGTVEGHETHYVTTTTKARWDGTCLVESLITLLTFVDERRRNVRDC